MELVEAGLVEQALAFIRRIIVAALASKAAKGLKSRITPKDVVREGIVNALVHRDYLLSATTIELSIYSDRLEIISSGRLPNGITPARMKAGCRAARNQLIKDVMRDYGYLEHMGMGVPRKNYKEMIEHNGKEPDLEAQGTRFGFPGPRGQCIIKTRPRRLPNDSCRTEIAYLDRFCTDGVQLRACWNPAD
jgi:ATP-dependent DNA helicase RecG